MAKYRKKPVEVEAFQWNGEPPFDWPAWARESMKIRYEITNLQVDTDAGGARCNRGDWIVKGNGDEIYPAADRHFLKNYEIVGD